MQASTIVCRAAGKKTAKKAASTVKKAGKTAAKSAKTTSGAEWYGPDRPGFLGAFLSLKVQPAGHWSESSTETDACLFSQAPSPTLLTTCAASLLEV